ncbi:hypothetical protein HMPREF1149_0863 [Streptococcus sp. BS35b]|nr:hypothetical protein HMPREF1149_0863 [Streptococcus sp. BS35b]
MKFHYYFLLFCKMLAPIREKRLSPLSTRLYDVITDDYI